jgi:uncharacterized protein (TIGR02687 family)
MNSNILQALEKLFERHRIVFWYDNNRELHDDFAGLDLPTVEKVEIDNNEFALKYRMLRQEPESRFLLYHAGPAPAELDNWFLDIELSHGVFYADQVTIWLNELELGTEYGELIREHTAFFKAAKRREAFKDKINPTDKPEQLRLVMLAICCATEARLDAILESLLSDLAFAKDNKSKLIDRCGLQPYLWKRVARGYGYQSENPGLKDFIIELFHSCYAASVDKSVQAQSERQVFLNRWKDSVHQGKAFEKIANDCAESLNIENDLQQRNLKELQEIDYFRLIDRRIISLLLAEVSTRTISFEECTALVRKRRKSHWYPEFADIYEAIYYAAQLLQHFHTLDLEIDTAASAIQKYTEQWFKIDQLYRKFIYHSLESGQTTLLQDLSGLIENLYSNAFLLTVNDKWQEIVDKLKRWQIFDITAQQDFFQTQVNPFLEKNNKVTVIISDALRYEIGDELVSLISREDRYAATLKPMLAMLPSYTQMGMAALLPHKTLQFAEDGSGTILVDGQSSQGTSNRAKILANHQKANGTAINAENLLALNRDECRALTREHEVVYVYHNRIDATGDKTASEGRVFAAVEESFQDLLKVIKKLTAANVSNILLTADHGFIYQNQALDESDFAAGEPEAKEITMRDRRFLLGKDFYANDSCKVFTADQAGLSGDFAIALPKSINRLRLKGSGSRFVHGGASLQEIIIPVVIINKKRTSDVSLVEVDILQGANAIITSGQIAVTFYQRQAATDKIQPRTLKAGIYSQQGELISDRHELVFDFSSDNPRDREVQVRFMLTKKADNLNEQEVTLRLDESIAETSHFREYKTTIYKVRRSFETDFDF